MLTNPISRSSTMAVSAEMNDSSVTSPSAGWTVALTSVPFANLPIASEVGGNRFSGSRLRINRMILAGASALLTVGVVVVVVVVVLDTSALALNCALNWSGVCCEGDPCLRWIADNRRPNPADQSS